MSRVTNQAEKVYNSKDVAAILNIQESTLRKYCIMLEKAGYEFYKNEKGHRGFRNDDVISLKKLKEIKTHSDMTLEKACNAIMLWISSNNETGSDTTDITEYKRDGERYNSLLEEFEEFKQQQESFNQELLNQLQKQNQYIKESIEERDRKLMEGLNQLTEQKRIEATQKQNWFKRLFSNK